MKAQCASQGCTHEDSWGGGHGARFRAAGMQQAGCNSLFFKEFKHARSWQIIIRMIPAWRSGKKEQAWRPCMEHTHAVMHAGRLRGSDTRSSCWVDECAWLTGRLGHAFPNAGERHSLVFGDICFTVTITLEIQDNVRCFALFFISQVKKLKEPIIQCHVFPSSHLWQGPSTMIESPPRGP